MAAAVQYYGTGRRKTSTARVFLRPGTGALTVNRRTFEAFFPTEALRKQIRQPLVLTEIEESQNNHHSEFVGSIQDTA